jgi:ribosomal protein S18 acetylase RimI-like enzyme
MTRLEIRPFSDEFLPHAGELLAARHHAHRTAEPLLPARFENAEAAAVEVRALARSEGASGAVALRGSRVVGFLLGVRKSDEIWGANVWVEAAGHAVEVAEDLRDLYGAAAARWVEEGRDRHYAIVPATDPDLVEAWSRVSFGQQHAYGIRGVPDVTWPESVRRAEERDLDALVELAPLLQDHQSLAPVFGGRLPKEAEEELRAGFLADLQKPEIGDLVAEQDGRIVGAFQIVPVELSSLHVGLARPDGAAFLGWAATRPDVRGSGAGLELTDAGFAWAREGGYETMVTDWRVTNLLASRFWPARGFRESFLRLYRRIP